MTGDLLSSAAPPALPTHYPPTAFGETRSHAPDISTWNKAQGTGQFAKGGLFADLKAGTYRHP